MLATSAAFTQMVEGVEQTRHFAIGIALPGGIYPDVTLAANAVQIESQLTTDLPEGTRLLEGAPSASATFTLAGLVDKTDETKTAEWLFGPYQTTSPLWRLDAFRSPVTIDIGLIPEGAGGTPELLRKFTGYVDSYSVNPDGGVEFTCIDARSDLRNSVTLPAVVTAPPFNAGLTSEFAIDYLLRRATTGAVSSWPKQRPQPVLAAGMRSSVWPEVGSLNVTTVGPSTGISFAASTGGSALRTGSIAYTLAQQVDQAVFVEWLFTGQGASEHYVFVGSQFPTTVPGLRISVTPTMIRLFFGSANGSSLAQDSYNFSATIDGGDHRVSVAVTLPAVGAAGWSASVWLDGVLLGSTGSRNWTSARSSDPWTLCLPTLTGSTASMWGLQISQETTPTVAATFTPRAVLDPSLNPLQVIPAAEGDPFQVIQQIVQAELAVAGFNEAGVFWFLNRNTLRGGSTVRTVRSSLSLKSLSIDQSAASVVNRAQVGYTPWTFATTATTVYSIATPKRIPRRSTVPIIVNLDSSVVRVDSTVSVLPNGSASTTASFYRASTDQAGTTEHPGLSFRVVQLAANQLQVNVTNAQTADAWLVSPSNYTDITVGTPVLRLAGFMVTPDTELTADYQYPPVADGGAAASRFGEVLYSQTGNPWLQSADAATGLSADVVNQSSQPIPNLVNVDIIPDPRLQLADRVRVVDPDETNIDEYAYLFGQTISFTANDDGTSDYTHSIDARTIARPGGWILGVTGRSELTATTYT